MDFNISFDNITIALILSQVFTLIAYLSLAVTYLVKKRKFVLLWSLGNTVSFGLGSLFLVIHGILGAWTAFGAMGIAIIRNAAFLINDVLTEKRKLEGNDDGGKKLDRKKITVFDTVILVFVIVSTLTMTILINVFNYDMSVAARVFSFFPAAATIIFTVSIFQKNIKIYRIMSVPSGILWIIYLIFVLNPVGILLESVLLGVVLASIGFYGIMERNDKKEAGIE